jgi:hypothetical protein
MPAVSVEGNDVPHHESLTRILHAHSAAHFRELLRPP